MSKVGPPAILDMNAKGHDDVKVRQRSAGTLTYSGQRLFPEAVLAQFASATVLITGIFSMILPPLTGAILDAIGPVHRYTFAGAIVIGTLAIGALLVVKDYYHGPEGDNFHIPPPIEPTAWPGSGEPASRSMT